LASGRHCFLRVQQIGSPVLEGWKTSSRNWGRVLPIFLSPPRPCFLIIFPTFRTSERIHFFQRGPAAHEQVPDGTVRRRARAATTSLTSPLRARSLLPQRATDGRAQDGNGPDSMRRLRTSLRPWPAMPPVPGSSPLSSKAGSRPKILDQFFGTLKAGNVTDDRPQSEGDFVAHAAEANQAEELRIGEDFLAHQAGPMLALFFRVAPIHQQAFNELVSGAQTRGGFSKCSLRRRPQGVVAAVNRTPLSLR